MKAALLGLASCAFAPSVSAQTGPLEEVVVRGSRYGGSIGLSGKTSGVAASVPASLSVVTKERISDQKFTTVSDALTYVTGVMTSPHEGRRGDVQSRGHSLNLLHDGVPVFSALPYDQQLDLAVYERLEVVRGPTAILQGAGEPGGSVNLVSKRGGNRFQALTHITSGTWDNLRAVLDVMGPLAGHDRLRGRLVGLHEERDHFARGVHYERAVGYGSLDWDVAANTVLGFSFAKQSDGGHGIYTGLPSYESGALLDVPRSTSVTQSWALNNWDTRDRNAQVTHDFAGSWRVIGRWRDRDQQTHYREALPWDGVRESDLTVPFGRRGTEFSTSQQGIDLFATGSFVLLGKTHGLLVGFNGDKRHSQSAAVERVSHTQQIRLRFDESELVPSLDIPYEMGFEVRQELSGLYVRADLSLSERTRLIVGDRLSDIETRTRMIAPSAPTEWRRSQYEDDRSTPVAALLFEATRRWRIYGSYAESFVSQSSQLRVGSEPLGPRIGEQHEVGAKADWLDGTFHTSIAIFDLRDMGRALPDEVNPGFFINAGEVQSKGWEMELVGSPAPRYEVQVGYSRLDSTFIVATPVQQSSRFSSLEPKHSWKAWATHRPDQSQANGWILGGGFIAQSGIEFGERSQGWYAVVNAMVGYRFNDAIALDLNVNNLFDERYYTRFGARNAYTAFGAPRNVLVTARITF